MVPHHVSKYKYPVCLLILLCLAAYSLLPRYHQEIELSTNPLKAFTVMEEAPTRAFSWLKAA